MKNLNEKDKKQALIQIFIVILCDIIGFGMIIPLIPILARDFGSEGLKIGFLISSYSIVQFFLAPYWGRLSDIFGRKSILLIGLLGSSFAHLFLAVSDTFTDVLLSRLLSGFFGGNIAIATAYIADVTSPKHRSKNIGLIGMAYGLGFTIGPIFGFLLISLGEKINFISLYSEIHIVALGASLFCFFNFLISIFLLRERQNPQFLEKRKNPHSFLFPVLKLLNQSSLFTRPSVYAIFLSLKTPKLGMVLIMSFILWLALAQIEPVLILLIQDDFGWSSTKAYSSFIYIGFLMVLSQGYFVRQWIPKWGESLINQRGLFIMSLGLMGIGLSGFYALPSSGFSLALILLFLGVTLFSIGYSLSHTSLNGALSLMTSEKKQGGIFGIHQSLSAAARITGPALGGWLYQYFSHEGPFFLAGLFTLFALGIAFWMKKDFPNTGQTRKLEDTLQKPKN